MHKHFKRFLAALISTVIAALVAGTTSAATTISTDILTGGTLTVNGLSLLNGNASTTQLSALLKLSVGGTATTTILGDTGTSTFSGGINLGSGGCFAVSGTCISLSGSGGSGTVNTGTLGQAAYYATNGTAVSGTSTLFIASNQNVGIGTTSPAAKLHIEGVSNNAAVRLRETTSNNYAYLGFIDTSGNFSFDLIGANFMTFTTNSAERMRITGTGSVGIGGTSTPGSLLSINNIANFTAATSTFYGTGGINLSGGCFAIGGTCLSTSGGGSGTVNSGTLGHIAYYAAGGTTVSGTSTIFIATNSSVGIGTTTPSYAFSVAGTIYSGSGGIRFPDGSTQTAAAAGANSGTAGQSGFYATGGTTISGTSTLFFASNQNVGIGTTSPGIYQGTQSKVDISNTSGHALVNINSALANTSGVNFSENGAAKWGIVSRNTFDTPNNRLAIVTGASTELLTILSTGKVGFGTTTPQWLLQLAASGAPQLTLSDNSSNAPNHWTLRNTSGLLYFATASPATFSTSTTPALAIDANGFLGIATATPSAKLAVNGNSFLDGTVTASGNVTLSGSLTLANSSTAVNGMVFGYCTISNSTSISTAAPKYFDCTTSVTTSAAHRVFVQATSSLPAALVIQAASSTVAGVINLQIYNMSTTTATAPGAISINFFGIR